MASQADLDVPTARPRPIRPLCSNRASRASLLSFASATSCQPDGADHGTALDDALDRIGLGRYQKKLLVLCGFGWMSDNLWLQSIAAILPRIQVHWGISDQYIGLLPSSMFAGMMCGAWSWGAYSDKVGRVPAFNGTLALAAFFGGLAGFAPSFLWLCAFFFCLGVGVGGSMPTDGTLFLENIPKKSHYLLTGLSVFFSVGAILASVLALAILPSRSCALPTSDDCDLERDNAGWRLQLKVTAGLTLLMFLCRVFLFKLYESPAWLVSAGRPDDAATVLQEISHANGAPLSFSPEEITHTPMEVTPIMSYGDLEGGQAEEAEQRPFVAKLPRSMQDPVTDYLDRLEKLMTASWRQTTLLVWAIWGGVSAGYTIFNAYVVLTTAFACTPALFRFLPSWLERKSASSVNAGLEENLQEFLWFTVAGLPGALLGAWMVETSLGQRKAMALSATITLVGILLFSQISSKTAIILSTSVVNLGGTLLYAIIYSYTPETFPAEMRGTACGIASATSRAAGIAAPLLSGVLLGITPNAPLYFSALLFLASALCMLSLPFEKNRPK